MMKDIVYCIGKKGIFNPCSFSEKLELGWKRLTLSPSDEVTFSVPTINLWLSSLNP